MDHKKVGELVVKAQSGDKKALNDLFGECYGDLYYFALKTVKNEDAAADAVQESAIDIINTIGELKNPEAFVLWSHRIVYCKCTKYFKQSAEICAGENEDGETIFDTLKDEDPLSVPENVVIDNELRAAVGAILETLPPEQRAAMTLYYFDELSVSEIAAIQEVSEGTVKSRLNYGRKAVKAKVEEYEEKTGTKLHSAFIPFMLKGMLKTERASICAAVPNTVGAAAAGAVQGAAVKAAAAPVIKTIAAGGKLVMSTKKLIAIIAASLAVVTAGGVAIGVAVANKSEPDELTESTAIYESEPDYVNNSKAESAADAFAEGSNAVEESAGEHIDESYPEPTPDEYFEFTLFETSNYYIKNYVFAVEKGTYGITVKNKDNLPAEIVLPASHEGVAITHIGYMAFFGCRGLVSVTIPNSVTSIGNAAFIECTDLVSIIIPDSVRTIDDAAFCRCINLVSVTIPNSITRIAHGAFDNCSSLASVTIPDSVTRICGYAFYNCSNLAGVTIPDSVKNIDDGAFRGCSSLTDINFAGTKAEWEAIDKEDGWNYMAGSFTIHCIDGDIN